MTVSNKKQKTNKTPSSHWSLEYRYAKESLHKQFIGQNKAIERLAGVTATYVTGLAHGGEKWVAPRHICSGGVSTGKSSTITAIAEYLHIPSITINCGSLVADSWKGTSLSDSLKNLLHQVNNDPSRIEKYGAIIFFDEFQKIKKRAEKEEHLQTLVFNLLPLLGGETVYIENNNFEGDVTELKTNRILIFLADAFDGISHNKFKDTKTALNTLLKLGYPREIVSRISGHTHFEPLNKTQTLQAIEYEANKRKLSFKMGREYPKLLPQETVKIALELQKNKLGLRSARYMIDELFFQKSKIQALRSLF